MDKALIILLLFALFAIPAHAATEMEAAAFMFILFGIGLLVAEFHAPGFGVLGISGVVSIMAGILLNPELAALKAMTLPAVVVLSLFFFMLYKALEARHRKPAFDAVGHTAKAIDNLAPRTDGFVLYNGEYWKAHAKEKIRKGQRVVIERVEGNALVVGKHLKDRQKR